MKHNKKTIFAVLIMTLISFGCLSLSASYAYLARTKASGEHSITTGNLTANLSYTANEVELTTMTDEEGMNQANYALVTIEKDNVYSVYYNLNIGYSTNMIPSSKSVSDLIPLEYVRIAVYRSTDSGFVLAMGPLTLADLPLSKVDTSSVYNDFYSLGFGTFPTGSDSITYAFKVWLSEDTPVEYDEKVVYLALKVEQEPLVSKSLYHLTGTVTESGSAVSGATVSLQNGLITSTSDDSGIYTLTSVPEGTYNLDVTYSGVTYRTTVHIQYGSSVSVTATNPANGALGSYVQNSAYTYYTSPGQILRANSLTTNTNEVTTSSYKVPTAYVITGEESISILTISNLKIALNSDNSLSLSIG